MLVHVTMYAIYIYIYKVELLTLLEYNRFQHLMYVTMYVYNLAIMVSAIEVDLLS